MESSNEGVERGVTSSTELGPTYTAKYFYIMGSIRTSERWMNVRVPGSPADGHLIHLVLVGRHLMDASTVPCF